MSEGSGWCKFLMHHVSRFGWEMNDDKNGTLFTLRAKRISRLAKSGYWVWSRIRFWTASLCLFRKSFRFIRPVRSEERRVGKECRYGLRRCVDTERKI